MASSTKSQLFLLGANHKSAAMELRERLFIAAEELLTLLPRVKETFGFSELVALSTCNRFELFGVAPEGSVVPASLYDAYLALQRGESGGRPVETETVRKSLYLHLGDDAVTHVYRVAASLDSLVLGETQITGQFKDALALAAEARTLGPTLTRLGQEALATAKKVRTQTAIGKKHVSISHAAVELAQRVFGNLAEHKVLVIGAGEMSQVAAKYVHSYAPKALFIANRTTERALALTRELGFGDAFGLDELPRLLTQADVIISCTAAPGLVIELETVKKARAARRGRPMIFIDIALPRDIDAACGKLEDVYLFDIDDLKQVVDANFEERQKAATEAELLVGKGVTQFNAWLGTLAVKPALAGFRRYLDEAIQKEAARTLSREHFRDLSPKQRESLAQLFEAIAGKLSGDAGKVVRNPPDGYFGDQLADALKKLFPDDDDTKPHDSTGRGDPTGDGGKSAQSTDEDAS